MNIESLRAQIPVTRSMIYMNTGWSGPMPTPVVERIKMHLEYEHFHASATLEARELTREVEQEARQEAANLLGATPEEILLLENTTAGINIVLNGLEWRRADEVVTCSLEHPSVLMPLFYLQRQRDILPRVVDISPHDDKETILEKFQGVMNRRTRLVALSHVQYSCGLRLPVREIGEMAHERGAHLFLDCAQSAGQVPLSVSTLDYDMLAFPGQKWLLGPDGVAGLYIRKDLIPQVKPRFVSYNVALSWDPWGKLEEDTFSMRKFVLSTSSTALAAGFATTLRFIQDIGIEKIETRSLFLAARLKGGLSQIAGVVLHTPLAEELSSGLVTFEVQGMEPPAAVKALWDRWKIAGRSVAYPSAIRFCTAFFNTEEEVDTACEAVKTIAEEGLTGD